MKATKFCQQLLLLIATSVSLFGCRSENEKGRTDASKAIAVVSPLKEAKVTGMVTFTVKEGGVQIIADFEGLPPGQHGFHVHEHGNCGNDGMAAGGHFNPTNKKHSGPDDVQRHVGDLGNIVADEKGYAHYERFDKEIALSGTNNIIGRSIIIHADADDFQSQPAGNSGARIGCGIIQASK